MVDEQPLEVAGEEVAHDAQRQLGLLVDRATAPSTSFACASIELPQALQEVEVALDVLGGGALGCGADDHAAVLRGDLLEDRLQAVALLVLEPARDAEPVAVRDVDDEAAGQRDLGREPRALRLHRVLDRLDEHVLAALDQILDLARALAALELGADDLVDVEEAVLLEADLDERGLHARAARCRRRRGRCCRRSSGAPGARGRPRRPGRPRARRRASRPRRPRSSSSRFAFGSGARFGRRAPAGRLRRGARLALGLARLAASAAVLGAARAV